MNNVLKGEFVFVIKNSKVRNLEDLGQLGHVQQGIFHLHIHTNQVDLTIS